MLANVPVYLCAKIDNLTESYWDRVTGVGLLNTVDGGPPRLSTMLKACWSTECVHFRFECEDDYAVANFTKRDDPLYDEDVVEIFIDETGDGRRYKEFEISPANVLFDALIGNDLAGTIDVNTRWDAEGIRTNVIKAGERLRIYDVDIPHGVFATAPHEGLEWRVNFYRIDQDREGKRHYWAWSPTGKVNYHLPNRFGRFVFA